MLALIKGKRTKRPRVSPVIHPRLALTLSSGEDDGVPIAATSSSSTTSSSSDDNNHDFDYNHAINSSTTSTEEDLAHCLILLAQGRYGQRRHVSNANDVVYQCKTCDRVFASFQALGGHRASHKKPKANNNNNNNNNNNTSNNNDDDDSNLVVVEESKSIMVKTTTLHETALSLQISSRGILGINNNNNKSNSNKVHECSVCGAEFTSGQALGGHMRKHRTTASFINQTTSFINSPEMLSSSQEPKKPRNVLELDLNLPATDVETTKFPFASSGKEQVIVFSAY